MKKVFFIAIMICSLLCAKAQVIPKYIQVMMSDSSVNQLPIGPSGTALLSYNGGLWWTQATYIEKDTTFKGVTNPNFTILKDTSKNGGWYEIGALLNFNSNVGKVYITFGCSYTDEAGIPQVATFKSPFGGSTEYVGNSQFQPYIIWVKPGTVMTFYTKATPGVCNYDCGAYCRFIRL